MSVDLLASCVIPPHEMRRLDVGEYETEELVPKLTVEHDADGWDLVEWIENQRIMEDGSLRLFLVIQNFSDQSVTVRALRDNP